MNKDSSYYTAHSLQERNKGVIRISLNLKDLCVLYIIAWVILPILASRLIFRLVAFACFAVFLLYILPKMRGALLNYALCASLLLCILFATIWLGQRDFAFASSRTINLFIIVILGLFSIYYSQYEPKKLKFFFYYILGLFVLVAIPSLIALESNAFVMRNASGLTERTGIEKYAGSYGYAYGCVFLETILVYNFRNNKHTLRAKITLLSAILLLGYLILNSGYTTAIILAFLGIIMALCVKKSGLVTIVLFGCIGIALLVVIPSVLKYILNNFDIPDVYKQKLAVLISITDTNSNVSYIDSTRGRLLMQGLQAIFQYPVLGSVILAGKHAAGGHQALVDVLANYGILYAFLYYHVVFNTVIRQLKPDPRLRLVIGLLLLVLGFTNTYDYTTFVIPLLAAPYIAIKAEDKNKNP